MMQQTRIPARQPSYPVSVADVPYRLADGRVLRALIYQPQTDGVLPALVCVHGGAWVSGDRSSTQGFADLLASCGFVVVAIDFRMAPHDPYPSSLIDINYAIRWVKRHAGEWAVDPAAVGGLGVSSGGHLILLSALRPFDARYASAPIEGDAQGEAQGETQGETQGEADGVDARLAFVITCSGVLDPLARYRMAQEIGDRDIQMCHEAYFGSEVVMSEASPPLILERAEKTDLPPALFFQGAEDPRVPAGTAERTAGLYRAAGGDATAVTFPGMGHALGEWGRREMLDVLARTAELVGRVIR